MKRKGVHVREGGKGHMTIIGLMMNTISPRTQGAAMGTHVQVLATFGAHNATRIDFVG